MDPSAYQHGLELFDRGEFYDAHEVLEDVWREAQGKEKRFLQAIIQLAVGLHHLSTGNRVGARSLVERARRRLEEYSGEGKVLGLDVEALGKAAGEWLEALAAGGVLPAFPTLAEAGSDKIPGHLRKAAAIQEAQSSRPKVERVPLLDLGRQYAQIREEVEEAATRVCRSQRYILGAEVAALEQELAASTGARHAVTCASGTDALWLALAACGVRPGFIVITTAFSFFATASAIVRAGARPVLVDVEPHTLNLDPRRLKQRVKTSLARMGAILPVHLYGQCASMDDLRAVAEEHGLPLIEDAAQAFGASWRGTRAGNLGQAAAFSFYPSKNLGGFGDGGCVTTNDAAIAERARLLRNHGSREKYHHEEMGWNSRLDEMQAAILRVKLRYVEEWNRMRRERAASYERLFMAAGLSDSHKESKAPVYRLRTLAPGHHVYHQYVIRVPKREMLRQFLAERGVETEVYYPVPLHLQRAFLYLGYREGDLPEAEQAAREVLALPMFPELTEGEQRYVVETIAAFYS